MDLSALKDAAIEAFMQVLSYLKGLLEDFIASKLG